MRHVLAITGMIDASAARSVEAAIRGVDPSATINISMPAGLVSVDSQAEAAAFCTAIEARGLVAEPTTRAMTWTPQLLTPDEAAPRGTMAGLIRRALMWGIAWLFITPAIFLVLMLIVREIVPRCGFGLSDAGACGLDLFAVPALAAIPGAIIAFAITFALGKPLVRRGSDDTDGWSTTDGH